RATFAGRVNGTVPAGLGQVVNTATVGDDGLGGPDANPADNTATDADTLDAAPNLVVGKSDGVVVARPGDTLTYTISVTNAGNQDATGVVLTDTLPANTSFVSASNGGAFGGGAVTWVIGNLAAGATVTRTVTVQVAATAPAGAGSLTNSATALDDGSNGPDPTPADNTGTDTDTLNAAPDLVVTKTDGAATAAPGSTLTYTITVTNAGNQDATGVTLAHARPAERRFGTASNGRAFGGRSVSWTSRN